LKIAFLQETANQNIGLMYLSALAKKQGHACELFAAPLEKDLLRSLGAYNPDLVGFSVITGAHHWMLETARRVRSMMPRALIIAGGPHPTFFPRLIEDERIDIIARGEADISFPRLLDAVSHGADYASCPGIWAKRDGVIFRNEVAQLVNDLSSLPHPDRSLYTKYPFFARHSEVPFSTTRGCPYRCAFCYNHVKLDLYRGKGAYLRTRNVEDVITEMEEARVLFPAMRTVILYDDIIGLDTQWLDEFSGQYRRRIGLPWFTSIRADLIDEFVVRKLKEAGCFCLSIGVETGDEQLREEVLKKRISNAQYVKAAGLLKVAGIKVRTSNMLFLPGEDIRKALTTIAVNRQMKADFAWAYTLQPYPGTALYEDAVKSGHLPETFQFDEIDPLGLIKPIIRLRDEKKILVVHRFFLLAVKYTFVNRLMKLLIHIPPNPLFDLLYYLSIVWSYADYHQVDFATALKAAWSSYAGTKKARK
jgi:radical SAM superfamily enzyme YgiQ (UPF0313 family)